MPPKIATPPLATGSFGRDQWVNVTWMPHTALSQSSHVCVLVRSAHHTIIDPKEDWTPDSCGEEKEWLVRVQIFGIAGIPLVPISCETPAAPVSRRRERKALPTNTRESGLICETKLHPTVADGTHDCVWDYLIHVPMRWRDLPRDSYLLFEVLETPFMDTPTEAVVYQSVLPLFSRYGKLVTGLQRVELRHRLPPDNRNHGLLPLQPCQDEHSGGNPPSHDPVWKATCVLEELNRSEERNRRNPSLMIAFGQVPSVPWLDTLERRQAQKIISDKKERANQLDEPPAALIVELPAFDIPILHEETFYPIPQHGASGAVSPLDYSIYKRKSATAGDDWNRFDPLRLVPFLDYENEHDNPVEDKYRALAHDLLRGLVDPALKPDREQRDRLAAIIDSPSHHPSREEKDLLWRFRFSLVDNRRALTKFLLAVDWTVESEVVQAAELLEQWRKRSPIEVTDALKLLGKHVAFQTNLVRAYAIDTLAAAPDSELRLYLLQLVQALKYENIEAMEIGAPAAISTRRSVESQATKVSSLATFLINRAAHNMQLANFLYWYLKVELENPSHGTRYREVFNLLRARLSETLFEPPKKETTADEAASLAFKSIVDSVAKLGSSFRGGDGTGHDREKGKKMSMWDVLVSQDSFICGLLDVQLRCRNARGKKDAKETDLRTILAKEGFSKSSKREPVPLPSTPEIMVNGVRPDTAKIFKSALYPALVEFNVEGVLKSGDLSSQVVDSTGSRQDKHSFRGNGGSDERASLCKVMLKTGDDLRQDQLIIMMIQLMDRLLKRAALDLCLTPYSILATSPTSGLVEFVDGALPISAIMSKHNNSILQYFQSVAPMKGTKYDIRPDVISTYIRSCAGYCVITYLLGVGDRHLDNILLCDSGHFFHIDFGFIFGRDPKPLPPAFRLTREMVDGMGGTDSTEYRQFCSLACQAFNALRKSAGLVLNLLHLMSDAGIEDLSNNPLGTAEDVIAKVEERFRLNLTDEQSERYFLALINDCLTAIAPRVMDVFHAFAVARR